MIYKPLHPVGLHTHTLHMICRQGLLDPPRSHPHHSEFYPKRILSHHSVGLHKHDVHMICRQGLLGSRRLHLHHSHCDPKRIQSHHSVGLHT